MSLTFGKTLLAILLLLVPAAAPPMAAAESTIRNPIEGGIYSPIVNEALDVAGQTCEMDVTTQVDRTVGQYVDYMGQPPPTRHVRQGQLLACGTAKQVAGGSTGGGPGYSTPAGETDSDGDGMGDVWTKRWEDLIEQALDAVQDLDQDELKNFQEFRWELLPVCLPVPGVPLPAGVPAIQNCRDYEANPATGTGGDGWLDGSEVAYWNNEANDDPLAMLNTGVALLDPDRLLDTDGDTLRNVNDTDADNDGLLDGPEYLNYGTYPEFPDSDCATEATECTLSGDTRYYGIRQGAPGTRDGINDNAELAAWNAISATAWRTDYDFDGLPYNTLDPDADGDGLLDGQEFNCQTASPSGLVCTRAHQWDTDHDGLLDGKDVQMLSTDPRFAPFTASRIVCKPLADGGCIFRGESSLGTNPLVADTDGDGMPDGWEALYDLNPASGADAGLDGDQDSYNPDGAPVAPEPWTNLQEYRYGIPGDWSIPLDGVWWWGTNPTVADTDGDVSKDGFEIHFGTDPTNGASRDPRGVGGNDPTRPVVAADPTNQNLPQDQMDPTNLQYLQEGRADAAARGNETVQVIDQLISAAIRGNVTQALNVLYNYTPVGEPLRSATQMVHMAHDAILNLIKCAPEGTIEAAYASIERAQDLSSEAQAAAGSLSSNPQDPTPALGLAGSALSAAESTASDLTGAIPETPDPGAVLADPQGALLNLSAEADDTIGCVAQVLLPFIDALLDRTLETVPAVADLVAQLQDEVLPGVVGTADALLPVELQATTQAFLERPVTTAVKTTLALPEFASNPDNLQQAVEQTEAAVDLFVAQILKPSQRHPQFLYDFTHGDTVPGGLPLVWEQVVEANKAAGQHSGGRADVVATVDSLVFNLYTNRDGNEKITGVPVGKRTCVQLDSSTTTRDTNDCDLYATMAVATSLAPVSLGAPTLGTRFTPTFTIEKAVPTATFNLEALGYLQLLNTPYVLVLGYNSNVAGSNPGLPASWEATLHDFDSAETTNRTMAFTTSFTDPRAAIPLKVVGAAFRVDENVAGKPVTGNNETVLELTSSGMANRFSLDLRRGRTTDTAQATLTLTTSAAMPLDLAYHDVVGTRDALVALHAASLPLGISKAVATYQADHLAWTWNALATISVLDVGYAETMAGTPRWTYQVNGLTMPVSATLDSNAALHKHTYQASTAPASLRFLVARDANACQRLDVGALRHTNIERTPTHYCMMGDLSGYTQTSIDSTSLLAHATGKRSVGDSQGTAFQVKDGNTVFLHTGSSPTTWDGQLSLAGNQTQDLTWTAATDSSLVKFHADLNQGTRHALLKADLTTVPPSVHATLDLATGQGTLAATNYVGSTSMVFSTTGQAPTQASPSDYLRLRILPETGSATNVESAWSALGAKTLLTRVAANGSLEVTGDYQALRPLSIQYHDASHDLALDVVGLSGRFGYWLSTQSEAGILDFRQSASNAPTSLHLVAKMPGGRVTMDLTTVPAKLAVTANVRNQTATLAGSSAVGHADIRYATATDAPTATGNSLVIQDAATGDRGMAMQLDSAQYLKATRLADRLTVDSSFLGPSPLNVHMENAADTVNLDMTTAPSRADVQYPDGSLTWTATGTTSFNLDAALDAGPRYLSVQATGAPTSLSANWVPRHAGTFEAALAHSGSAIPELRIQDFRGNPAQPTTGSAWSFHALQLPADSYVSFDPSLSGASATLRTATNTVASVGRLEVAFAQLSDALPDLAGSVQGLWMKQAGESASAVLVADGLRTLDAPLLLDAVNPTASPRLRVDRTVGADFTVHAESEHQDASYDLAVINSAPDYRVDLRVGTTAADGFAMAGASNAASGATKVRVERGRGLDLAAETTGNTPATFNLDWKAQSPIRAIASAPATVSVQVSDTLANAPWQDNDFVALKWNGFQDQQPRFGLHLTDLSTFTLDPGRSLQATGPATVVPFAVDYAEPATKLQVQASDLGPAMALTWNSALRNFELVNTAGLGQLRLQVTPASDSSPRLLFGMDQVPSGTVSFAQGTGFQSFLATAPAPVGRLWVSVDQGGTGAMQTLAGPGFFLDSTVGNKPFQLNLAGVRVAEGNAGMPGTPFARFDTTGNSPLALRLNTPHARLTATATGLSPALARIEWPNPAGGTARFYATGLTGTAHLDAIWARNHAQVDITGSPATWSIDTLSNNMRYTGSSPATSLQSSGLYYGTAYSITATGVPGQVDALFGPGFHTGNVAAPGSSIGHLTLAWAPGGQLPVVSGDADLVMVDAAGAGDGLLRLSLGGLKSATWTIPDASGAAASTLQFHVERDAASSLPATLQAVHAHHQTRLDLPNGLPATLDAKLDRSLEQWKLTTTMTSAKQLDLQHQDASVGSLTAQVSAPGTLTVAPKANRAMEWNGSPASITLQSRWNEGYVDAKLVNGPSKFAVDSNGLKTWSGSISTLNTGTVERATVLLVPDAGQTVNRVTSESDYAAVELMGKGPYAEVNAQAFQAFTWMLPNATGQTPAGMTLARGQAIPGKTLVVLSGMREDVTAKITNAAATVGFTVYQSNNTGTRNPRPVQVQYTSTGGITGRVDLTHVASDTGQLLSSYIVGASGTTNLLASGGEPARISITASGNQGGIGFETTDLGTLLKMNVQGLTSRLVASVTRGTCDATSPFKGQVSTQGTGTTGPVQVFIGDGGNVPNMRPGQQALDARCQGATAHVGVQLPTTTDTHWDTTNCNADYSFGANRERSTYYVETSTGFLDAAAALESQNAGTVAFRFTSSNGVRHSATDRMSILSEKVTFPTCMQFRDMAKWYTLSGTSVARDLHLDMHARGGALGDLPTLTLESPSLEASGTLNLDVRVAGRYYEQWHKARLQAGSPIGKLDAFIGSTDGELRRGFGDADGFQFINDGNINWHIQFQNLRRLVGSADRACQGMDFDVQYERTSGSRNMVDYINLGDGCDKAKFTVDLPSVFSYELFWTYLTDVNLDIRQTSQTIQEMKLWSDGACFSDSSCMGYGTRLDFEMALRGVPAGSTDIRSYVKGATGILHMVPSSGTIDDVRVGFANGQSSNYYAALHLSNARVKMEWDLDGDDRFPGSAPYFYFDTANHLTGITFRDRFGHVGLGIGAWVVANAFQIQIEFDPVGILFGGAGAIFKRTGYVCGDVRIDALIWDWWVAVPTPLLGCLA